MFSTTESLTDNTPLRTKIHRCIFLAALIGVCVGMPLSNGLNSICQAILAINWVVEGNYISKLKSFIRNKPAIVLFSFYVMHLIGLIYTSNFAYGFEDLNKKLPLFLFPFVLSTTSPLLDKEKKIVILSFLIAVTLSTLNGGYMLITHKLVDIHDISEFIAPVRLAMMIALSVFLLVYYVCTKRFSIWSVVSVLWISWFLFFLFIMQSLTVVIMLIVISLILLLYYAVRAIRKKKYVLGLSVIILFIVGIAGSTEYVIHFYHEYFPCGEKIDFSRLDKKTVNGNPYGVDNWGDLTENGHYDILYICWPELQHEWNKRSKIQFDSTDLKGNPIRSTIIRYMTSLGIRKDSVGVWSLTEKDINAIQLGIPNYRFNSLSSMSYRLFQVFWDIKEYQRGADINGHSVTMRLEYSRIALILIHKSPLVGVGTGDVRKSFDNYYNSTNSPLKPMWRLRAHDQYLEIAVGFGLIGLAWFIISLFYPGMKTKKMYTFIYFVFWMIVMLSMLTEDTLETEAGSTFYAFFNSFFLFL